MTESAAKRGSTGEYPRTLRSNADEFFVPAVEERRAERERDEAHVSLITASFIVLVADVLWALVSTVLLSDFRLASLAVLLTDAAVVSLTRKSGLRARTAVVTRGLVGIVLFGLEIAFFEANSAYILGQLLIAGGAVVFAVGRVGEGRNALGGTLVIVGLILAMVIGLVQEQARVRALSEQFLQAMELALVGQMENSRDVVNQLLEDNPDDPSVYLMAIDYFASDVVRDLDTALAVALRAVELADGEMELQALLSVAQILAMQQDLVGALGYVERAIDKDDSIPGLYMLRAQVLVDLGRTQDALSDLRRVEEMAPDTDLGQQARLRRLTLEGPDFSTIIQADR